jgi:hypothetical protein
MAIKIIQGTGQTCNKFWLWANLLAEAIEKEERLYILVPDISFIDYPNLQKNVYLKFPVYSQYLANMMGYSNYIKTLSYLLENCITKTFLNILFKFVPQVSYYNLTSGEFKSSFKYQYKQFIDKTFTPKTSIVTACKELFKDKKGDNDLVIGIHIRYGDYRNFKGGKYFYSLEEYINLMKNIMGLFPNKKVSFFICCNENISLNVFKDLPIFAGDIRNPSYDLFTLRLCDYIIGPPSTFSGWAAYLSNRPIYFIEELGVPINLNSFKDIKKIWHEG